MALLKCSNATLHSNLKHLLPAPVTGSGVGGRYRGCYLHVTTSYSSPLRVVP